MPRIPDPDSGHFTPGTCITHTSAFP